MVCACCSILAALERVGVLPAIMLALMTGRGRRRRLTLTARVRRQREKGLRHKPIRNLYFGHNP
jgi:hypothetical protein